LWLHSLKVAQLLRSATCLHTNQSRSYLNHLVYIYNVLRSTVLYRNVLDNTAGGIISIVISEVFLFL